jgi:hypothetical protein
MMDSRKERYAGEEDDETNLGVEAEFTGDIRGDRKSSPNLRRKFAGTQAVDAELWRDLKQGGKRRRKNIIYYIRDFLN